MAANDRKAAPPAATRENAPASLDLLYRSHHAWLLRLIRRRFGHDQAEDLAQETYLRASAYQGRQVSNPRALLSQIATRVAIDRSRRERVRPPAHGASTGELTAPADQEEALALKQTILQLPPRLREVFLLSRFGGLSYEEIAIQLGLPLKTVEWRMSKALKICTSSLGRRRPE